jgi:hypothetical protein
MGAAMITFTKCVSMLSIFLHISHKFNVCMISLILSLQCLTLNKYSFSYTGEELDLSGFTLYSEKMGCEGYLDNANDVGSTK